MLLNASKLSQANINEQMRDREDGIKKESAIIQLDIGFINQKTCNFQLLQEELLTDKEFSD